MNTYHAALWSSPSSTNVTLYVFTVASHGSSYITTAVHTFSIHILSILSIHTIYTYILWTLLNLILLVLIFHAFLCRVIVLLDITALLELETWAFCCVCKNISKYVFATNTLWFWSPSDAEWPLTSVPYIFEGIIKSNCCACNFTWNQEINTIEINTKLYETIGG